MYKIDQNNLEGKIAIYDDTMNVEFVSVNDEYIVNINGLTNVEYLKTFTYSTFNENNNRYLTTQYRISRDGAKYTDWLELYTTINNFPPFNPKNTMYVDLKFTRNGYSEIGSLNLLGYTLNGSTDREMNDGQSTVRLNSVDSSVVIKPPFIYKVFKIIDIELIAKGDASNLSVKYRFSQDYGRTVSQWEPFTKENISTVRINPIRFFQIEYLLEYSGSSNVSVYDINIIGDFQNVTLDGLKTNLLGIRENCDCLMLNIINGVNLGLTGSTNDGSTTSTNGYDSCGNTLDLYSMSEDDKAKLFNPYQITQAVDFLNVISNSTNEVFGHDVLYFVTDPDKKGTDYTFHEYQLLNYICEGMIKVSVDGNNFPDNQMSMNMFDLSLFESFEIHIPKDTFKKAFGVEKRPSKEDFLWFCEVNRMYQVEHTQQFRNFNNAAVYYKVILKKYSQKANILAANDTIASKVQSLVRNTTIDELFGLEVAQDKDAVANKEQFKPLTKDKLRVEINAKIRKEEIINSVNIIAKTVYDLSDISQFTPAVMYRNMDSDYKVSDNIGYMCWFNIYNYIYDDVYNLFNYYDDINNIGFKADINDNKLTFKVNTNNYVLGLDDDMDENIWFCYVVNVDQRQRKITQYIYKRNTNIEADAKYLKSTKLKIVYKREFDFNIENFDLRDINANILGSDMMITNIRLFTDIIPEEQHNIILNQEFIEDDSKYLVFADNANEKLTLPFYPLSNGDE